MFSGPRRWGRIVGVVVSLLCALWGWGSDVGVSIVGKVRAVTVLNYEGRLFEGNIPLSVELSPGSETFVFVGTIRLEILSNVPWKLGVSLRAFRIGGEEVRPEAIYIVVGKEKVQLGAGSTPIMGGDRGIWPLELGITVALPPGTGGPVGGEAELILEISLSGARP